MPEEDQPHHSEAKSEIAQEKPRDEEGHFIHVEPPKDPERPLSPQEKVAKYFGAHTTYDKSQDDILDVHVGNPLRKITQLLEEIKKQKAFSFTLKGSLGIAGVALALGVFGIMGAGNLLCEKGVQKEIGVMKVLNVQEEDPASVPFLSGFIDFFAPRQKHNSVVLVKNDESVISIPYSKNVNFAQYANYPVIATGNYDSCGQSLKVNEASAVEIYLRNTR